MKFESTSGLENNKKINLLGKNSLSTLNSEIKINCSKCKKIAIIIDKKVPKKFLFNIKKYLKRYKIFVFSVTSSEKIKLAIFKKNFHIKKNTF